MEWPVVFTSGDVRQNKRKLFHDLGFHGKALRAGDQNASSNPSLLQRAPPVRPDFPRMTLQFSRRSLSCSAAAISTPNDGPSYLLGASGLLFFLNFGQVSVKYSTPRRLPNGGRVTFPVPCWRDERLSNGDNGYVGMVHPGHRARVVDRLLKGLFLILLTMIGFVSGLPLVHVTAGPANDQTGPTNKGSNTGYNGTVPIRQLGADPVPNLSLPKTIVSGVNDLVGAGGVISSSSQNLTLYNSAIRMRLLGTPNPHDVLLDRGSRVVSSYSFWSVQVWLNGSWESLVPSSNNFTLLGTNKTGTFVVRTMQVSNTGHSGVLSVVYKATSAGPLKWDLAFTPNLAGQYRLLHIWENITSYQMLSASEQFRASLSGANYTLLWDDVPTSYYSQANVTSGRFLLSINLGSLTGGSNVLVDPSIVSQSTSLYATAWTFQRKVFFEPKGGYYFVFYYNGSTVSYRYSHDGVNWSLDQPMPSGWPAYIDNSTSSLAAFSSNQQLIIATGGMNTTTSSASVLLR